MYPLILVLAAVVVATDQATKYWAVATLSRHEPVAVIGELIQFRLAYNAGAAFSIGADFTWLLTILTAVAVGAIVIVARRVASRQWAAALGLILGGATTHLLDRLLREPGPARGRVVDFIDYGGLFVGNIADIALFVGVAWAVLLQLRGINLAGANTGQPAPVEPTAG